MSKEEKTLSIIDETIQAAESTFQEFIKVLEASRTELVNLENEKKDLSQEKEKLENEKKQLENEKISLEADKKELELDKTKLEKEKNTLELEKQERDKKIGALSEEQVKLLDEYERLKVELKKFASAAAEAEDAEFNFERIKALLSIYTVLIEKIFQGQPHYRILMVLHGQKLTMSREEIKNTTGISGAFVLRAIQELAKVGLVEYDMDTNIVKLKKRLFPKKALEEKK